MTAVAAAHGAGARPRRVVAPTPPGLGRRALGTLHEPNTWTVTILLVTSVAILARHPIAHALGTEVDVAPATVPTSAPAATGPGRSAAGAASVGAAVAIPTHAPRDPFRALVSAAGVVLAPEQPAAARPAPGAVPASSLPAGAASCAGSAHRVAVGDTLWTLAARAVRSHDTGRVTVAWHRLYAANRTAVGADPALLRVGTALCIPTAL